MSYTTPADVRVSASYQSHIDRNPPSGEPGTDYATNYGTDLRMAGDGIVVDLSNSNDGGTGRFLAVDMYDGRRFRYLHLSEIMAYIGQHVFEGQRGIVWSGASGFGSDYGYGSHVHVTLFPTHAYNFGSTLDFELYAGEDDDMNAEQDNRLKNVENLLQVAGAGYGWPEVGGKASQDVQSRIYIYDENGNKLYDVFQLLTNTTNSINRLVYITGGIGLLSLAGIITLIVNQFVN
jgi:murein DD-endopeptidase MepM/ murein hydrolase activator NlpD